MAVEIVVPALGESVVEAQIGRWLKKEGDTVTEGEAIAELLTDKVDMEVTANASGVLTTIKHQEGATVGINEVLAILEESGASNGASAPKAEVLPEPKIESPVIPSAQAPIADAPDTVETASGAKVTPVAQKIALENKVDLAGVKGSGAGGKIVTEDVNAAIKSRESAPVTPAVPTPKVEIAPVPSVTLPSITVPSVVAKPASNGASLFAVSDRPEERVKMSRRRQMIAAALKQSQNTAAMLTTFNEVDLFNVMEVRKRRKDTFKEKFGVNLGFMSFFTKAVVGALKQFPYLNAEIQGDEIVLKKYYDIGIAVAAPGGLMVPIVRNADRLSFAEIEKAIADVAGRAREDKVTVDELKNGSFTITNGGVFGSLLSTPILNYPQVGILGMHKIQERPVVVNSEIVIRPMMYVALSYDHRIVDGSESVKFLVKVKDLLEDPETLLLEG